MLRRAARAPKALLLLASCAGLFSCASSVKAQTLITLPAGSAAPAGSVDTTKAGFKIRTVVTPSGSVGDGFVNGPIDNIEAVLNMTAIDANTGQPILNEADPTAPLGPDVSPADANGYYALTGVINLDIVDNTSVGEGAGHGNFISTGGYLADPFPGVPGINGQTVDFVNEIIAFLQLKAGTNHFGVNSDDDFKLTFGYADNPRDAFAVEAGEFTGGRGATDSLMDVVVPSDGLYAMRLIFDQGGGDANLEFFTIENGVDKLVNASTNSVKAFQANPVGSGPFASSVSPLPNSTSAAPNASVNIQLQDGTAATVTSGSVVLKLDGTAVTPTVSKTGATTSVIYTPASIFQPSSSHSLELVFNDSKGGTTDRTWNFTVSGALIPPSIAVTGVDTSKPGFKVRPYQVTSSQPNTIAWTEEMFAGLHGTNIADLSQTISGQPIDANGFYTYTDVINWDEEGSNDGNFTVNNGYQDTVMPGQPSADGNSIYDNDGEEVLTFLSFASTGVYTMGVNSDDGFKVTTGTNPRDQFSGILCGQFNGGRGSSDTLFQVVVQQAGVYPFRLLWENGGGGANCEWFTVLPSGAKVLINDPSSTNTSGVKAYYSGPALPAYVQLFTQSPTDLKIVLQDAGTQVKANSAAFNINGAAVKPQMTQANGATTVTYTSPAPFASGSTNTLILTYMDNNSKTITNNVTFVTATYVALDASWAVTGVDTTKPGFKVKPYQVADTSPNTIAWTEQMFAGQHGPNIADLTQTIDGQPIDTNGYYTVTGVVNWDKEGGADGNFTSNNGFDDAVMPGQPSGDGTATYNNDGEEVLTFLQFPASGFYTMGVNSDDGFRVTSGPNPAIYPPAAILGQFDAGRGASDTLFLFYVPKAGFYPFRLLWENGGSGANCEWFTVQPDGTKILVNDKDNANAIKAFYSGPAPSNGGGGTGTTLSISLASNNLTIQWAGGGTLQSAAAVNGPWTDVTGKTSPATIPVSGTAGFYRVRQ